VGVEDVMKRHDALGGKCRKGDERMSQNGERKRLLARHGVSLISNHDV
jgi:hypothetical protein